jgi:hypothetical protein
MRGRPGVVAAPVLPPVAGEGESISQLYDEPLYDFNWKAFGTPWCRVNYHPDRCERDPVVHEHVVWQKDDELRRTRDRRTPVIEVMTRAFV